jgi:uncharacterized protein YkwD
MPMGSRAVTCLLVTLTVLFGTVASSWARSAEGAMVAALNEVRVQNGLGALRPSSSLASSASTYAAVLMRKDWFGHGPQIQASPRFSTSGEILAMHSGRSARRGATIRAWLGSPAHRGVILSSAFSWMGAGRSTGRFGQRQSTIWVVHFGG